MGKATESSSLTLLPKGKGDDGGGRSSEGEGDDDDDDDDEEEEEEEAGTTRRTMRFDVRRRRGCGLGGRLLQEWEWEVVIKSDKVVCTYKSGASVRDERRCAGGERGVGGGE